MPLREDPDDFRIDLDAVAERALGEGAKLVFVCSPGNPAGGTLEREAVLALARQLEGKALVVVDEAYVEFADVASLARDAGMQRNLVVLRTLSKAHALAAARIGVVIADAAVIGLLRRCQAPYPVPQPCSSLALRALSPENLALTRERIALARCERLRLGAAIANLRGVRRVYPSSANFLLVRFDDAGAALASLLHAGIVVRDQRAAPQLDDALRISLGTPEQNDRVLKVLGDGVVGAPLWRDNASPQVWSRQSGAPTGDAA